MPSPIAHTAVAYTVYRLSRTYAPPLNKIGNVPTLLFITTGFSLLPDIDSGVGILTGDFGRFHNNLTHSLFVGLTVATIFAVVMRWRGHGFAFWFLLSLLCYQLHIVMDAGGVSRGVMALWPFTSARFVSPVPFFYGFHWSDGLISLRHLWTLLTELGFTAVLLTIVHFLLHHQKRNDTTP
jgi:hypothetical protein